jgi:flavodoxin
MKTCVAYYSKTGNIEIAAEYLAEKIGAKAIKLDDKTNYKGIIGFLKGGLNASTVKKAELDKSIYSEISKCNQIVLATPVWAGKTTPAINSVLENVDFKGKEVYVMTTQADPAFGGEQERKDFYKQIIESKEGKLIEYFSLVGTPPGKPARSKEDLKGQVDNTITIK